MTSTENPIDNDDRLKRLLSKIRKIKSQTAYGTWRKQFLGIYTKYLDKNGILNGKDANYRLLRQLGNLSNRIRGVVPLLENGTLHASTKGRRLLKNLTTEVVATERKVQELLPKTHADEERFGFDKFELAAVLLEDGFHGYDAMRKSRAVLEAIVEHIENSEDNDSQNTNEIAIFHQYSDSVESFVRVMEDLKLVQIMNHCVDIVYKGSHRPEPKPPPPPSGNDDDEEEEEEELPEDSSICSDLEGDSCHVVEPKTASAPRRSKPIRVDSNRPRESTEPSQTKTKPKNTKASETVSRKVPTKTKKKPKKQRASSLSPALGVDNDNDGINRQAIPKGSSRSAPFSKSSRKPSKKKSSFREDDCNDENRDASTNDNTNNNDSSDSEEEDENEQDQNQGGPPEFLLYFDPKTNAIGRIHREQALAKSTLIVDQNKQTDGAAAYADAYQNVVDSQEEKQELIFVLKKLEKQKPPEESWLDAIKREKAEASAIHSHKKLHKSTSAIRGKRRSANGSNLKSPTGSGTQPGGSSASRRSSASSRPKSYKLKIADKPDATGWTKPASTRGLKQ